MTTWTEINDMMTELSNLVRDSSIDQRQAAMRTLLASELAADWYTKFPGSVGARHVDAAIAHGSIGSWVGERVDSIATTGTWTLIKQRGPGALTHSNRPDGRPVSDAVLAERQPKLAATLQAAIDALVGAGVVNRGVDDTDRAFGSCGGSVSHL